MLYLIEVPHLSPNNKVLYKKPVEVFEVEKRLVREQQNGDNIYEATRKIVLTKNSEYKISNNKEKFFEKYYRRNEFLVFPELETAIAHKISLLREIQKEYREQAARREIQLFRNLHPSAVLGD